MEEGVTNHNGERRTIMIIMALLMQEYSLPTCMHTVFENHRKSLIQQCEQSELRLHFEWTKVN